MCIYVYLNNLDCYVWFFKFATLGGLHMVRADKHLTEIGIIKDPQ